jgi:hypothetical protein
MGKFLITCSTGSVFLENPDYCGNDEKVLYCGLGGGLQVYIFVKTHPILYLKWVYLSCQSYFNKVDLKEKEKERNPGLEP